MSVLSRFGVSLEEGLLEAFDRSIGGLGYQNRSEAIRDLIRDHLIQKQIGQGDPAVIGVVTLVYDHHPRARRQSARDRRQAHRHQGGSKRQARNDDAGYKALNFLLCSSTMTNMMLSKRLHRF
jgi:metal-responsive CopG/Arc/MetJ family transcriptional regulator